MNWLSADKNLIWHPYTQQKTAPEPILIEKAAGAWLYDDKGRKILDAISSWWVTLHGHGHPYIAERVGQQAKILEQVIFAGFTHKPAIALAEKLVPLLPGVFTKIFYSDNGSTATEVAIKMALQYWWNTNAGKNPSSRKKILAFKDAYHGDTFGAMSVSGRSVFTEAFADQLFEVVFIDLPDENNMPALSLFLEKEGSTIAAFIYEPLLQGAGGMNMYSAAAMDELLQRVKAQEILCIADEVLTGFGRTGRLFAGDYLQEKADIICLSKGLTGGTMALGVTACSEKIYAAYWSDDRRKTFFHGHSFTANPLACTAALASLELFEKEDTLNRIARIASWNSEAKPALEDILQKKEIISGCRQLGTILAFEIGGGTNQYLKAVGQRITADALKRGLYLRPLGNTLYTMPPFCLEKSEHQWMIEQILDIVAAS